MTKFRRRSRVRPGSARPWGSCPWPPLAVAFLVIPFIALLQRVPWSSLSERLRGPIVTQALRLSLTSAYSAMGLSLLFGVPLAWVLARTEFPGRSLLRALVILPMVLPPVVGGAALLFAFGRRSLFGGPVFDHAASSSPSPSGA